MTKVYICVSFFAATGMVITILFLRTRYRITLQLGAGIINCWCP